MPIPPFDQMFNPLLEATRNLGGSGSNAELVDETAHIMSLSDEELEEQTSKGRPRLAYRLAWACSYLKAYGLLDNSERGVWSLTQRGTDTQRVDPTEVKRFVRSRRPNSSERAEATVDEDTADTDAAEESWRETLLGILLGLDPAKFERLSQRILRESGFVQVKVTGRAGDGGIDGTGTVELGGLLAFPVLFQCKRYQGSVGPSVVRDFRGALVGRADRGLILTTGIFSRDARREARRDGAPPIDLVDRDRLLDKLKELRLGVEVQLVESISIKTDWFSNL